MTFALFLLYLLLSYIYPGEIIPALVPYRITYWVGMAGLAVAIASLFRKRTGLIASVQLWGLALFTGVMCLSLMIAEHWVGAPILTLQRFGPSLTTFVLALCGITSLTRLRIAAVCVIVLTTALVAQGAAAYHFGVNTRLFLLDRAAINEIRDSDAGVTADTDADHEPAEADTEDAQAQAESIAPIADAEEEAPQDAARIRALGFMHDPNDLALAIVVALGLTLGLMGDGLMSTSTWHWRHLLMATAAIVMVYGIHLTRSRGGAVALVIVLWRFAARRVGLVSALVLLALLGAGVMARDFGGRSLSTDLDESASERIVAWTEGFDMLKTSPIFGVGFGEFSDHHTLTAHNSLVLCFAETGLVGCFLWVGLVVVTLLELHGLQNLPGIEPFDDVTRQWAEGLQLALIGFLVAAFFLSRTFVPTLYLILGVAAALTAIARGENRSVPLPALPELGMRVLACELAGIAVVYTIVKLHAA
jgi:putative inorganic carbon (hco3(-)) transporter